MDELRAAKQRTFAPRLQGVVGSELYRCPGCGCQLEPYEVFASRTRGLRRPICMGCAYEAVAWLRDELIPLTNRALARICELFRG